MKNSSQNPTISSSSCLKDTEALLSFTDELLEFCTPEEIIELLDSLPAILTHVQVGVSSYEISILEHIKRYFWNIYKLQIQKKHETEKEQLLMEFEDKLHTFTKSSRSRSSATKHEGK